jgi:hypothetical protein
VENWRDDFEDFRTYIKTPTGMSYREWLAEREAQAAACPSPTLPASGTQVGGHHYKLLAIQPSEFIFRNNLNWCAGNIVKYASRAGRKGPAAEDIRKIIHYAELWLEWLDDKNEAD